MEAAPAKGLEGSIISGILWMCFYIHFLVLVTLIGSLIACIVGVQESPINQSFRRVSLRFVMFMGYRIG